MKEFEKLGIIEPILKTLKEKGFETPTEIQSKSIPLVMAGKDVIGGSATGSGKTLAFASGIIDKCENGAGVQALILTPTRELTEQVAKATREFSKFKHLKIQMIYGGVAIGPQIEGLHTAEIIVGTPGRILDHLQRGTMDLSKVKILVLDEADVMLEMGFIDDVEKIIRKCPVDRQTLMFSATIAPEIEDIASRYMKNPDRISVEQYVDPSKLTQIYYDVGDKGKYSLLVYLLKKENAQLVMVFCNTKSNVDFVSRNLKLEGIKAKAIHGGFSQNKRSRALEDFHNEDIQVLVCTDVAARGLDIRGVTHVYNYDSPNDAKQYIHRIGRTARAGKDGVAINLLGSRDHENFNAVLHNFSVDIRKEQLPKFGRSQIRWKAESRNGSRDGSRGGFRGGSRGGSRGGFGRGASRDDGPRRDGYRREERKESPKAPKGGYGWKDAPPAW